MSLNKVMLAGRLVKDPNCNDEGTVAWFVIAVRRNFKNKDGEYDSDFIKCNVFGRKVEYVMDYLKKGSYLNIVGSVQSGSYEKNNETVYYTNIVVDEIHFIGTKKEDDSKEKSQPKYKRR